jgi:hypothetical protein
LKAIRAKLRPEPTREPEPPVDLTPGQQLYVKILSSQSWDGACRDCVRDTFYAWLIPPEVAQVEIGRDRGGI